MGIELRELWAMDCAEEKSWCNGAARRRRRWWRPGQVEAAAALAERELGSERGDAEREMVGGNGDLQVETASWKERRGLKQAGGGDGDLQVETATWSVVVGCEWGNGEESCCGFGIER